MDYVLVGESKVNLGEFSVTENLRVIVAFARVSRKKEFDIRSWITAKWTNSDFYHVKILIDNIWIQSTLGGVTVQEFKQEDLQNSEFDFVEIPDIYLTDNQYLQLKKFIESVNGQGYDWMQILLTHFISLHIDHLSKWTCSELVTKLLQLCYFEKVLLLRPERVTPKDLADILGIS